MRMLRTLTLILFIFTLSLFDNETLRASSPGGVSGSVRDSRGIPLAGVAVSILEGRFNPKVVRTVNTDNLGKFEVRDLLPGLYSLSVQVANYLPLLKSGIGVVSGKIADLNLILENFYQQTVLGLASDENQDVVREDINAVLRSASSNRPILRVFDSPDKGNSSGRQGDEGETSSDQKEYRGVVSFYATAFSSAPDLASAGGNLTDFALAREIGSGKSWLVAGVVSDSGFTEVDSVFRLRDRNGHSSAVRVSFGALPYLALPLTPIMERNVQRLNIYNIDFHDEIKLSDHLFVLYGTELQATDPGVNARKFRPRWGVNYLPSKGHKFSYLRTTSLPQLQRVVDLQEGESIQFSSPFQHEFGNRLNFGTSRVAHSEIATDHTWRPGSRFVLGAYSDDFSANNLVCCGMSFGNLFPSNKGIRVAYLGSLGSRLDTGVGYTYGGGIHSYGQLTELATQNFHVITARLRTEIPTSKTQVSATYRWISGDSITIIDPYQDVFDSSSPGVSLMIAQVIPYFGRFLPGKLEAQIDVRNLFAKNYSELYNSPSLRRIDFLQPAKLVRGGLKLKF